MNNEISLNEGEIQKNRSKKYYYRLSIFIFVIILSIITMLLTKEEFKYFLKTGKEPIKIGNIQELRISGIKELKIPHNSFVQIDGLIMTKEGETKKYNYFYCPLFNIIVQTKKPLPEKQHFRIGTFSIPQELMFLVQERKVFPEDFSESFGGKGRILKFSKINSKKYKNLRDFYGLVMKVNVRESYLFLEGETPLNYWWYFLVYISGILLILITGSMFLLSARKKD